MIIWIPPLKTFSCPRWAAWCRYNRIKFADGGIDLCFLNPFLLLFQGLKSHQDVHLLLDLLQPFLWMAGTPVLGKG